MKLKWEWENRGLDAMLDLSMVFLILAACLLVALFFVGQYNALVTVRHRIATVVLEMDFLLQQQAADQEADPEISLDSEVMEELKRARSASHRAASNAFAQGAIEALNKARKSIEAASRSHGSMRMQDSQIHMLDETALKLEGLVTHYHAMLRKKPASWIAVCLLGA